MRTMARLLSLASLVFAGCATIPPEPASDDRYEDVVNVLGAHGFAPPTTVRAADSSIWIVSSRPGKPMSGLVERVIVRLPGQAATPKVEIRRYVQGPTDWAIIGPLFGDETVAEARAIHDDLKRRLTREADSGAVVQRRIRRIVGFG